MNRPPPSLSHHSFTFLPQNSNPNMLNPLPSSPDLTTTLAALKTLIYQSETAVSFTHDLLNKHCSTDLSACPFDPRHRMPPEFMFRHHLRCPSSNSPPLDLSILESLRYPKTLKSQIPNSFLQHLLDPYSELCFSLDQFGDFGANFFYRDCPGVVELDRPHRTLTLPGFLSIECANFVGAGDDGRTEGVSREGLLPSELWQVRREIGLWNDFPSFYSYTVLQVVLGAEMVKEGEFLKWVIANSPLYGIVIDVALRDHIFVLFRLVLKTIMREAVSLDVNGKGSDMNSKPMRLECPNLVQAMKWLTFQFTVLYGEANGKFFAINMLKQYLFNVASGLLSFVLEENVCESAASVHVCGKLDAGVNDIENAKLEPPQLGSEYNERAIFVSQVAAAVAALHERSLLEEKIKSLRLSQPLPRYKLIAQHAYLTAKASEERRNNPNYKPILEHDGLLWQRSRNEESSKTRTREELLAEERDYKRRRMSYRGKKLKQTTTQVMRDIIEEYMEEIKQAGGVGSSTKGAEEKNVPASKLLSSHDLSTDTDKQEKFMHTSSESREGSQDFRKQPPSDYKVRSRRSDESYSSDYEQHRRVSHGYERNLEYHNKSFSRDKNDREYNPRSSERSRSHGRSHKQTSHRSKQGDAEVTPGEQHELSSSKSKYRDNRVFSSALKHVNESTMEVDDRRSEAKDRWQRKAYGNHLSESTVQNLFDDRYDPSVSEDMNDVSSQSKYIKPDELYR